MVGSSQGSESRKLGEQDRLHMHFSAAKESSVQTHRHPHPAWIQMEAGKAEPTNHTLANWHYSTHSEVTAAGCAPALSVNVVSFLDRGGDLEVDVVALRTALSSIS
jgi:hypothetical protein